MTFIEQWQASLPASYYEFAKLATSTKEPIDFTYGLLAAAVLDPANQPVKQFDEEAIQEIKRITQVDKNKNVLRFLQSWSVNKLEVARLLAKEAHQNTDLRAALQALIEYFNALPAFTEALARAVMEQKHVSGNVYHVAEQIRAGLVSVGGETNIQTLTINFNLDDKSTGAGPVQAGSKIIPQLPYEPETIEIAAGPFLMGSPQHYDSKNWQQHTVNLPRSYKIGKCPVTNAEYAKFVEKNQDRRSIYYMSQPWSNPNHPVVGISWDDAVAYCKWLGEITGRKYRLPTEAEWEKAARGDQDSRLYPWGDELRGHYCNYNSDQTTPVQQYPQGQSPYGCFDMVGNVWEWTSTLWGDDWREATLTYPYKPDERESVDVSPPAFRIYRGGAYHDDGSLLGCCIRNFYAPQLRARDIGFRVALDLT